MLDPFGKRDVRAMRANLRLGGSSSRGTQAQCQHGSTALSSLSFSLLSSFFSLCSVPPCSCLSTATRFLSISADRPSPSSHCFSTYSRAKELHTIALPTLPPTSPSLSLSLSLSYSLF